MWSRCLCRSLALVLAGGHIGRTLVRLHEKWWFPTDQSQTTPHTNQSLATSHSTRPRGSTIALVSRSFPGCLDVIHKRSLVCRCFVKLIAKEGFWVVWFISFTSVFIKTNSTREDGEMSDREVRINYFVLYYICIKRTLSSCFHEPNAMLKISARVNA